MAYKSIILLAMIIQLMIGSALAGQDKTEIVDWGSLREAWQTYVDYPSTENAYRVYTILPEKNAVNSGIPEKKETIEQIYKQIRMLERQVISSDRNAVKLAFRLFTISDGAFSEYLCIMLGSLIRINPTLFLEELKAHRLIVADLTPSLLGNHGYDYVDRFKARELETNLRINALESVKDETLVPLRDECIKILENGKNVLSNMTGCH